MGQQSIVYDAEQPASACLYLLVGTTRSNVGQGLLQFNILDPGQRDELGHRVAISGFQKIPPAFRVCKNPFSETVVGAERVECTANGVGICIAHQFANELLLASQGTMALHPRCSGNRIAQPLVDGHVGEHGVFQADHAFAEFL